MSSSILGLNGIEYIVRSQDELQQLLMMVSNKNYLELDLIVAEVCNISALINHDRAFVIFSLSPLEIICAPNDFPYCSRRGYQCQSPLLCGPRFPMER